MKAAASVKSQILLACAYWQRRARTDFLGVVLYDGADVVPFGDKLVAACGGEEDRFCVD